MTQVRLGRVRVSGGCLALLALLFYFDENWMLARALAACLCHELGHWGAIRLLGGAVQELHLTAVGAELRLDPGRPLSYGGELLSALAGPAVNFLLALAAAGAAPVFSGVNLVLGLFNLLPVLPLDGGRVLYDLLALFWSEGVAERVCGGLALALSLLTAAGGGVVLWKSGHNVTLLLVGLWLFFLFLGRKRVAKREKTV